MPNDNILHNDIRVFKSKPDGPVVEISNTALSYHALERKTDLSLEPTFGFIGASIACGEVVPFCRTV